jgi:hypothetical protein
MTAPRALNVTTAAGTYFSFSSGSARTEKSKSFIIRVIDSLCIDTATIVWRSANNVLNTGGVTLASGCLAAGAATIEIIHFCF